MDGALVRVVLVVTVWWWWSYVGGGVVLGAQSLPACEHGASTPHLRHSLLPPSSLPKLPQASLMTIIIITITPLSKSQVFLMMRACISRSIWSAVIRVVIDHAPVFPTISMCVFVPVRGERSMIQNIMLQNLWSATLWLSLFVNREIESLKHYKYAWILSHKH